MEFKNQSPDLLKVSNFASMVILKLMSFDTAQISQYTYKDVLPIYCFSSFKQLKLYFDLIVKSFDKKDYLDSIKNNGNGIYYFIVKNPNFVITKIYKGVKLEDIMKDKRFKA